MRFVRIAVGAGTPSRLEVRAVLAGEAKLVTLGFRAEASVDVRAHENVS